jgi:hypothetical protein
LVRWVVGVAAATVKNTYDPRHPNDRMSAAMTGAPMSRLIAHEVSKIPIDRPRSANGTRFPIQAWPAIVAFPTPITRIEYEIANVVTEPPSAIIDEATTPTIPSRKTRLS